jgi:Zn-dependent protease with chaperone function
VTPARLYDGRHGRPEAVAATLATEQSAIEIQHADGRVTIVPTASVRLEPALGRTARRLWLDDTAYLELEQLGSLAPLEARVPAGFRFVNAAERRLSAVLIAVPILLLLLWVIVKFGIPVAADSLATKLSPELLAAIDDQVLKGLDTTYLDPSKLLPARQMEIVKGFRAHTASQPGLPAYHIEFRKFDAGPNAFALPGGAIIITDEMVEIAQSNDELFAVLGHELGHVHHRHGMKLVLRKMGLFLLVSFFLGDVSPLFATAGALPAILVETGYSRHFESEADDFAVRFCIASRIGLKPMIALFRRLRERAGESALLAWLSTHPALEERLHALERHDQTN